MLLLALFVSFDAFSTPILNSYPSAKATVYLDFDGYYVTSPDWNGGVPFQCAPAGMTDAQITEVFNRVSEDYRPFNINITTDSNVFNAAPATQRTREVITPTSAWYPGVGGISFVGSFTWGDETPSFIFCNLLGPNDPKMVAECCSHETGHTLGLYHQSTWDNSCNLLAVYSMGDGSGEVGWAPIMGNSYYRNMTGWYNGLTPYACSLYQDNLSVISTQNGFGYRTDDYSDDINGTPTVLNTIGGSVNGLISTSTDKDAFKFTMTKSSNIILNVNPYSVGTNDDGADLDAKVELYNSSKQLLGTYDPPSVMSVSIDTTLAAGDYYMVVEGTGNSNTSDYGSLGSYSLMSISTVLPIQGITLQGKSDNSKHDLSWDIKSTEAIASIVLEYSTDGANFNSLQALPAASTNYSYAPFESGNIYYRLKVTSVSNQMMYSNTLLLNAQSQAANTFTVSTLVQNSITVNAPENYNYQLNTISGASIVKGTGMQGTNTINIENQPSGVYVLQLISNGQRQVERIIKQ